MYIYYITYTYVYATRLYNLQVQFWKRDSGFLTINLDRLDLLFEATIAHCFKIAHPISYGSKLNEKFSSRLGLRDVLVIRIKNIQNIREKYKCNVLGSLNYIWIKLCIVSLRDMLNDIEMNINNCYRFT